MANPNSVDMFIYELSSTLLFCGTPCAVSCTIAFSKCHFYHTLMQADLRISIKDYRRSRNLKILLLHAPFAHRQFFVRMNGAPWPKDGRPVSLTKLLTSLRKALVKTG
jgi:hypothetical protein